MKIQINKTYPMPCSPDVAWEFLQNLEAVAACMPGAKIMERLDAGRYKGTVTARVGPATMSFRGEVEMRDVDQATRSLRLLGKGTDSTGNSGAALSLAARIDNAAGDRCALVGTSEMSMSGKAASFGGRMMNTVADQILQQFAANFAAQVSALETQRAAAGSGAPANNSAPAGSDAPASAVSGPAAGVRELNVLALAWTLFQNWLRRLFSRKAA
jgi:uncharacterized protein